MAVVAKENDVVGKELPAKPAVFPIENELEMFAPMVSPVVVVPAPAPWPALLTPLATAQAKPIAAELLENVCVLVTVDVDCPTAVAPAPMNTANAGNFVVMMEHSVSLEIIDPTKVAELCCDPKVP